MIEPVTAVVLAATLLGEPPTVVKVLGGVLLLGAVVLLYLAPGSSTARAGEAGERHCAVLT